MRSLVSGRSEEFVHWEAAMNFLYLGELALERGDFSEALEYAEISVRAIFGNTATRLRLSRLCDSGNGCCENGR